MGYSRTEYPYNGGAQDFPVNFSLGYLKRSDVRVYVKDELDALGQPVYRDFTWINDGNIRVTDPIPVGSDVVLERTVDKGSVTIDPATGGDVTRVVLASAFKRQLMIIHELLDGRVEEFNDIAMIRSLVANATLAVEDAEAALTAAQTSEANASQAALDAAKAISDVDAAVAAGLDTATSDLRSELEAAVNTALGHRNAAADSADAAAASAAQAANFNPAQYLRKDQSGVLDGWFTVKGVLSVDNSVDSQGVLHARGGSVYVYGNSNVHYWFRKANGDNRAVIYADSNNGTMKLQNYWSNGSLDVQVQIGDTDMRLHSAVADAPSGDSIMTRERVTRYVDGDYVSHRISEWDVRKRIAQANAYDIGTYIMAEHRYESGGTFCAPGYICSGSKLHPSGAAGNEKNYTCSGTWKLMGAAETDESAGEYRTSIWLRIG